MEQPVVYAKREDGTFKKGLPGRRKGSRNKGTQLHGIFVENTDPAGMTIAATAEHGKFLATDDPDKILFRLTKGRLVQDSPKFVTPRTLGFDSYDLPVSLPAINPFRGRSTGETDELYVHELWRLGYGGAGREAQAREVARQRLEALASLGVDGLAQRGPARLLSEEADPGAQAWVRWNMQWLDPAGYSQAVRMLCGDDIHRYPPMDIPATVYCGSADTITPPDDCRKLAVQLNLPFKLIDGAGHACYIEQPDIVAEGIRQASLQTFPNNDHE